MIDKELFQQALEVAETALDDLREAENEYIARYGESYRPHRLRRLRDDLAKCEATIAALRDRLARQEQCPHGVDDGCCKECYREATQPARQERDGRPSYWYARSEDGTYIVGQGDVIIAEGMAGEAAEAVVEAFKMNAAQKPARQEQCEKDPRGCWNVRCQLGKECIKPARQEQEQEPVAWRWKWRDSSWQLEDRFPINASSSDCVIEPLYTAPPARVWQGLTDEDWQALGCKTLEESRIAVAVVTKLREKNAP